MPRALQRAMAGEAEAAVQARAKVILSQGEAEASERLVAAGQALGPVSVHLRYLQTMLRISQPLGQIFTFLLKLETRQRLVEAFFVHAITHNCS